jgi:energy-coupling factor transporter transmembrane protein EcfT
MTTLNPSYKFVSVLLAGIALSLSYDTKANAGVCLLALLLTSCAKGLDFRRFFLAMVPFVLAAFGFFMTGLLFAKNAPEFSGSFGQSQVDVSSMATAWQLSTRVMAFGGLALLFSLTTEPETFFRSLRQQLRLPAQFCYGLTAAYHFLPVVRSEHQLVRAASLVRGARSWPWSSRVIIPMLVRAFRRSERLAMAMESRGFNPASERGEAALVPLRLRDVMFMTLPLLAACPVPWSYPWA